MMKKTPTADEIKDKTISSVNSLVQYKFIIIIIVVGLALAFALLKTRSFINIPRNEARFTEEVQQINYKEIANETLEEFKQAEQDGKIEVNSDFDPDRQNPFTE